MIAGVIRGTGKSFPLMLGPFMACSDAGREAGGASQAVRHGVMKGKRLIDSLAGFLLLVVLAGPSCGRKVISRHPDSSVPDRPSDEPQGTVGLITVSMGGDVMTGRGIDQVLPHPGDPRIHEAYLKSAIGYVDLAEKTSGPIQKPVDFAYIWGDALEELERVKPDVRMINLETSVTESDDYWRGKGIHYRMSPLNVPCLAAARIDVCSLANNHVLDWGYAGLAETLETLREAQIDTVGAGRDLLEAEAPAVLDIEGKGRVIVFAYGLPTSGIPDRWRATEARPGVNLLQSLSDETVRQLEQNIEQVERPGDIVVVSIHWGSNWGYDIPSEQVEFAHKLIDSAGVDVIHGHSSHHVRGIEVYRDRLVLYGCGDLINDYEGISGYEWYRGDLALVYLADVDPSTGKLVRLQMIPMQTKQMRLDRASRADALWLRDILTREGKRFGTRVEVTQDTMLSLEWD
jgi:poly-gamma-glutamate synthesis protein (capsule biosynthesis protein)